MRTIRRQTPTVISHNLTALMPRKRDELCRAYFAKMKSRDHKLNALVPNGRSVPYVLRLYNKLPIPRANTNRYKNSLMFRAFSDRLVMYMYFNRQFNLI